MKDGESLIGDISLSAVSCRIVTVVSRLARVVRHARCRCAINMPPKPRFPAQHSGAAAVLGLIGAEGGKQGAEFGFGFGQFLGRI